VAQRVHRALGGRLMTDYGVGLWPLRRLLGLSRASREHAGMVRCEEGGLRSDRCVSRALRVAIRTKRSRDGGGKCGVLCRKYSDLVRADTHRAFVWMFRLILGVLKYTVNLAAAV
jgi:hypothetical protein